MKKILIVLSIFGLMLLIGLKSKNTLDDSIKYTMYEDNTNITNVYYLDFKNEVLSTNNLKLKVAPFTGYQYVIRKIYPKYNSSLKEYYTYDFNNINDGIDKFKQDYISYLRDERLYDEIDKVNTSGVIISGIEIYTTSEALHKYLKKYPKVEYKIISEDYNQM